MESSFIETMLAPLRRFFAAALEFLPALLAALVIIAAGWLVAWALKLIIRRLLGAAKFDRFCANAGMIHMLRRADIYTAPSELASRFVFWLIFAVFLTAGVGALGVEAVNQLVADFFLYLPRIFAALLILLLGFLIGNFLSRAVLIAAVNAHLSSPRIMSGVVKYLIAILAFAMALDQLQIARSIVTAAFAIAFGAFMLGLAIAFGLGGRDVARQMLERRFIEKIEERERDEFSHI
jgi:hypothetical protein